MLRFYKIHPTDAYEVENLQAFYTSVYTKCFTDINECERLADMIKYLVRSQSSGCWTYTIQIAVNEFNESVGGVIYDYIHDTNTGFIEFLCVHEEFRREGYASLIFDEVVKDLNEQSKKLGYTGVHYIFAEMDKGSEVARFYASKGLRKLELDYIQPALSTDKAPVTYLQLNATNLDGSIEFDKDIVLSSILSYFSYAFNIEHVEHTSEYKVLAESIRNNTKIQSTSLV